jgi:hypothetical protein
MCKMQCAPFGASHLRNLQVYGRQGQEATASVPERHRSPSAKTEIFLYDDAACKVQAVLPFPPAAQFPARRRSCRDLATTSGAHGRPPGGYAAGKDEPCLIRLRPIMHYSRAAASGLCEMSGSA